MIGSECESQVDIKTPGDSHLEKYTICMSMLIYIAFCKRNVERAGYDD